MRTKLLKKIRHRITDMTYCDDFVEIDFINEYGDGSDSRIYYDSMPNGIWSMITEMFGVSYRNKLVALHEKNVARFNWRKLKKKKRINYTFNVK